MGRRTFLVSLWHLPGGLDHCVCVCVCVRTYIRNLVGGWLEEWNLHRREVSNGEPLPHGPAENGTATHCDCSARSTVSTAFSTLSLPLSQLIRIDLHQDLHLRAESTALPFQTTYPLTSEIPLEDDSLPSMHAVCGTQLRYLPTYLPRSQHGRQDQVLGRGLDCFGGARSDLTNLIAMSQLDASEG